MTSLASAFCFHRRFQSEEYSRNFSGSQTGGETHRVRALTFIRFRRSGTIPTEIGELTGLTDLRLDWNDITGQCFPLLSSISMRGIFLEFFRKPNQGERQLGLEI